MHDKHPQLHPPVKFVEYCSLYGNNLRIFDEKSKHDGYQITKNQYQGIRCECMGRGVSQYADCSHHTILQDRYFVEKVVGIVLDEQEVGEEQLEFIGRLREEELRERVEGCGFYEAIEW